MTYQSKHLPVITAITPQRKNRGRFSVFIDNAYAFSLSQAVSNALRIGQHLTESEIDRLTKADEAERAFAKGMHYLSFRPRSIAETTGYLKKKEFNPPAIDAAIRKLEDYGYLDDLSFAQRWVENRIQHRPRGRFALRYELSEKGIPKAFIDTALSGYDEHEAAWRAVSARLPAWSELPAFELKKKIYRFLTQKGFAFETCEAAFNKATAEPR